MRKIFSRAGGKNAPMLLPDSEEYTKQRREIARAGRTVKVRKLVYQEIKEPPNLSEVFHFYRIIKLNLKVNFILIQSGYCNRLFSSKKSMKPLIILSLRSSISFSVKSLKSSDIFLSS